MMTIRAAGIVHVAGGIVHMMAAETGPPAP
jgi:hypothetical protein